MEDRLGSGSVVDPSFANPRSDSKATGEKRSSTELVEKSEQTRKRVKMRDLESVFRSEGSKTHYSESSRIEETTDQFQCGKIEETSQITEPITKSLDTFQTIRTGQDRLSLLEDATHLSLGHIDIARNQMDVNRKASVARDSAHDDTPAYVDGINKPSLFAKHMTDCNLNPITSGGIGLDLNAEDMSSSVDHDPFFPCKIHGRVKSSETSECGSSTGPVEEKDSLRVWKEMKQNGFLSSSHGGIPIPVPKRRGRKSKNDMHKKKMELAKREQVSRFTKIAAPSGLLNELNPGIINHVRNSKQVHSIIEALVRSEKLEDGHIGRLETHLKRGTKEVNNRRADLENMHDSRTSQLDVSHEFEPPNLLSGSRQTTVSSNKVIIPMNSYHKGGVGDSDMAERRVCVETSGSSYITSDCKEDTLKLKLSSSITTASEDTSSVSNEESENQTSVSSLSAKGAHQSSPTQVPLQLLNGWSSLSRQQRPSSCSLLVHAALRRSKKRVRTAIQTQLPFLLSKEFSSNQESDPYARQSFARGCPKPPNIATLEMHRAKWTALFEQMKNTLSEEAKHLERWLNQVKEMQLHCERGLQCVNWIAAHGIPQARRSENESRPKKTENSERELAIRAAATSIYSTSNFAMSTENVSCF